ncbi:glycosyltransferase family 4 protein [Candidatus Sumerlaeota bacterium]|nr:glycosyltransferase family 4 protein [Candidatus Sumerlaeota bacterium]
MLFARSFDIRFTFAGEGPDEGWLRTHFSNHPRVVFSKYLPRDATDVHLDHDVAVAPSIASEGTSFSVGEAMGAGCAVVATAVGGITNMVIDRYNGILVLPNAPSLLAGMEQAITNAEIRREIGLRAYETARSSLNVSLWKKRWAAVIEEVCKG